MRTKPYKDDPGRRRRPVHGLIVLLLLVAAGGARGQEMPQAVRLVQNSGGIQIDYGVRERFRPVPEWLKERLSADDPPDAVAAYQEGEFESRRTLIVTPSGFRYTGLMLSRDDVAAEDVAVDRPFPVPLREVYVREANLPTRWAVAPSSGDPVLRYGSINEGESPVPEELRLDIVLGFRSWGDDRRLDPGAFEAERKQVDGREMVILTAKRGRRVNRWVCDPTRGNLVLAYDLWDGRDPDTEPPHCSARLLDAEQRGDLWVPTAYEWADNDSFYDDDKPQARHTITIRELSALDIAAAAKAMQFQWVGGMLLTIESEDGSRRQERVPVSPDQSGESGNNRRR